MKFSCTQPARLASIESAINFSSASSRNLFASWTVGEAANTAGAIRKMRDLIAIILPDVATHSCVPRRDPSRRVFLARDWYDDLEMSDLTLQIPDDLAQRLSGHEH